MLKIQDLREIIELIDQSSLQEFNLESDGIKLTIRKESTQPINKEASVPTPSAREEIGTSKMDNQYIDPIEAHAGAATAAALEWDEQLHKIVSPMVGTFYSKSDPSAPAFTKEGDQVKPDSIVCIVEAMKLFNEIEAEVAGEIVKTLVADGQLVEYGQPLFLVKPV